MDKNSFENYEKRIEEEFVNSTIFNTDSSVKVEKKAKKSNRYIKLLSCLLCSLVVIGVSIFGVVKFLPEEEEEQTVTESESSIELTSKANVSLEDMEKADKSAVSNVEKIYFKNKYGEFTLVPYSAKKSVNFKVVGFDKDVPVNQDYLNAFKDSVFSVYANSKIDSKYSEKDCGLDNPRLIIKVTMADGTDFDIKIGNTSAIDDKYYISTSLKEGIYLTDCDVFDTFNIDENAFVSTDLINAVSQNKKNSDYFVDGELKVYDKIVIDGENFKNTAELVYRDDDDDVMVYYINKPVQTYASSDNIDTLLGPVANGLTASSAVKIKPSSADLKKYGLDNPYFEIEYVVNNKSYSLKFGKPGEIEANSITCMVEGTPVVYSLLIEAVPFVEWKLDDLRYNLLYLRNIETIKAMTTEYNGKSYKYDLSFDKVVDEDSETSSEETELTVLINSSPIDDTNFKTAYQRLSMASATKYLGENIELSAKPELTVKIELTSGKTDVITYTKYNKNYYLHKLNGVGDELISSRTVELLITNYERLRKGEEVVSPNNEQ